MYFSEIRLKVFFLFIVFAGIVRAGDIKGLVIDKEMDEPLMGAMIKVEGTALGAVADMDGRFVIRGLKKGTCTLEVSYISFFPQKMTVEVPARGEIEVKFLLEPDNKQLDEITIVAQKRLELESALLAERRQAVLAIENLGAGEMSIKGISNAQDGVKKLSGISIADAGQLIVRGLGDRYSTTTLNGLPIASPNPDNKLIPLDIFPSSAVQNITVSKVYEASAFADYSGAHVDISTKEGGDDFFNVSFGAGTRSGNLNKQFYTMDRAYSLFRSTPYIDQSVLDLSYSESRNYLKEHDIFGTTFEVAKRNVLPDLGGNVAFGKTFVLPAGSFNLLGSLDIDAGEKVVSDAYTSIYDAQGSQDNYFNYNSYSQSLEITGLFNAGYSFRKSDHIGMTAFYARNINDKYQLKSGYDSDVQNELIGSNQTTHIYELQNYQLQGSHDFGHDWNLQWSGSLSNTQSDEPDRRQVMFQRREDGTLDLFRQKAQETMRYFGTLDEQEWAADVKASYKYGESNKARIGFAFKDKVREYECVRYYYDLNALSVEPQNVYSTDGFLNHANVASGQIVIQQAQSPSNIYGAQNRIYAAFLETDYYPVEPLMINVGVRMENSEQAVDYATTSDKHAKAQRRDLNTLDFFPALNAKYSLRDEHSIRFAASRTVTRPLFIEMAPFLYQESYGAAQTIGNADLVNGYNYNVDLKYEFYRKNSNDMLAVTVYYKYLDDPIERIQQYAGGTLQHSFKNADDGSAAGVELEYRQSLTKSLRFTFNGSYMYTNVKLPEGGDYTNSERALQGASPYLLNADLSYTPSFENDRKLFMTLLYNLQGERIQSVGVSGMGDVVQTPLHTLDFICGYQFNSRLSVKLQLKNLLNSDIVFEQELPLAGRIQEVERFNEGIKADLSISFKL